MLAGRIDAVKNASNYDNNSVQNQRVMRPQRGPEHAMHGVVTNRGWGVGAAVLLDTPGRS